VIQTLSVCLAAVDDRFLKSFDRKYSVRTSGHLELSKTSFDAFKLRHATSYGPVNAWAFRSVLRKLKLHKELHFVDLGSGLGRACILAAEYGFEKVTGVELAPELCAAARKNLSTCRLPVSIMHPLEIVQGDVLDYCEHTDDDVFFIYRAFSLEFFRSTRKKLSERAADRNKCLILIYTERLSWPVSDEVEELSQDQAFRKVYEATMFGQVFRVYQCGGYSECQKFSFHRSATASRSRPRP
jgi:SAM-dependent methyltransferase